MRRTGGSARPGGSARRCGLLLTLVWALALPVRGGEAELFLRRFNSTHEGAFIDVLGTSADPAASAALATIASQPRLRPKLRAHSLWRLAVRDGARSREALREAALSEHEALRLAAARGLGIVSRGDRDLLGQLSKDPAPEVRAAAVEALGKTADPRLESTLLAALDDADREVRDAAWWSLSLLATRAAYAAAAARLDSPDPRLRARAVEVLGTSPDAADRRLVRRLLVDPDKAVRRLAVRAVVAAPPVATADLEAVLARSKDAEVRAGLLWALLRAGQPREVELVEAIEIRLAEHVPCMLDLTWLRRTGVADVAVARLAGGRDRALRVAPVLSALAEERGLAALGERVAGDGEGWSVPLVEALAEAGAPAVPHLERLVNHPVKRVRQAVLVGLRAATATRELTGSSEIYGADEEDRSPSFMLPPEVVFRVDPWWSAVLSETGHSTLRSIIGENGVVKKIRPVESSSSNVEQVALTSARGWLFHPGRVDGRSIDVVFTFRLSFLIHSN